MKVFQQKTEVHTYQNAQQFVDAYAIGETDFILASESIYHTFFEGLSLKAEVRFKKQYGHGEPTDAMIDALLEDFRHTNCSRIIAIGGGAVIDMAKILVLDGTYKASEIFRQTVKPQKVRTLIAVPTTCGAGSEVSNISIAEIEELHTKFGLAVDTLYPDQAVLVPEFLSVLPFHYFGTSAIDALIHAIESYVSPRATLYTQMFSKRAMEMILNGFRQIAEHGAGYRSELFEEFLIASNLAGIAFGNAGTGAVHAMSYPLGAVYHVTHGEANYQFLTEVFHTYQKLDPEGRLKELDAFLAGILCCETDVVYEKMEELLGQIVKKKPLHEFGMKEEEIESFAVSVEQSQQRLLNQSFVKFDAEQMKKIYRKLF